MKRVLAVLGDYYHDAALAGKALGAVLEPYVAAGWAELSVVDAAQLAGKLEERPDLAVLFAENRTEPEKDENRLWMTPDAERKIDGYVAGGGAWLAWHSGMASYPADGAYVNMLKGRFLHHPEQHAIVTYSPVADTALGPLGAPFRFKDEHYFVECREEETNVFLRSASVDGESVAGWFHAHGAGRVACLAPAHLEEGLLHPDFVCVMRRVVAWCLQLDEGPFSG